MVLMSLISTISLAQDDLLSVAAYKTVTEAINPSYQGKWGWHKIHKISLNKTAINADTKPYVPQQNVCSNCHKKNGYRIFDPHVQLNSAGSVMKEKCLYCHKSKPDVSMASFNDVELIDDLKFICQRCHGSFTKHPAGISHFVQPSKKIYRRMVEMRIAYEIIMPLDYDGKLTCITCHNPHEKGVIPDYRASAKGSGGQFRHRLPNILCQSCHGF
jgi:hypothetical protein